MRTGRSAHAARIMREQGGVEGRDGDGGRCRRRCAGRRPAPTRSVRPRRRRSPAWPPRRPEPRRRAARRRAARAAWRASPGRRRWAGRGADQRAVLGEPHVDLDAVGTLEQGLGHRHHGVLRTARLPGPAVSEDPDPVAPPTPGGPEGSTTWRPRAGGSRSIDNLVCGSAFRRQKASPRARRPGSNRRGDRDTARGVDPDHLGEPRLRPEPASHLGGGMPTPRAAPPHPWDACPPPLPDRESCRADRRPGTPEVADQMTSTRHGPAREPASPPSTGPSTSPCSPRPCVCASSSRSGTRTT